jgi:23S rRNA (adenine2030-N6)-methyltransferase
MNYRHAFHAGNFADCMKHALLVWLLRAMARKPAGFFVLDTHAGAGRYDLATGPAARTGEWRAGIGRLLDDPPEELSDYLALVRQCGVYPGSPVLIRALLRPQDRLACCELQPDEFSALKRAVRGDDRVAVHRRDAWEALGALLPPRERRALVLVDPPYEPLDDFSRLAAGLRTGHARSPNGVFAAWYPIKHRAPVREFHAALRETGVPDIVAAELWLREPLDPARLNGCGLAVINPPFRFEVEAPLILHALLARLGAGEPGAGIALERLADE